MLICSSWEGGEIPVCPPLSLSTTFPPPTGKEVKQRLGEGNTHTQLDVMMEVDKRWKNAPEVGNEGPPPPPEKKFCIHPCHL